MHRLLWFTGYLWGAPITAFGLLQAAVGARFVRADRDGVMHFVARGCGPVSWFMRRFQVNAYTLGAVITYSADDGPETDWLVRHERVHVVQTLILGPLMAVLYPGASAWALFSRREPYRDNWFEVQARRAEGPRSV